MTLAEKLRNEGYGKADFTKESLMSAIEEKIKKNGEAYYILGRHVGTNLKGDTIGECNSNNRDFLLKCLGEEGFKWDFRVNTFGVTSIKIRV